MIKCDDIHLSFGAVQAIDGVSLSALDTGILAVIGPNGAGKTCLLNCIVALLALENAGMEANKGGS